MRKMKYDASNLFYGANDDKRFIPMIDISKEQKDLLLDARKAARIAIQHAFMEARKSIKEQWDKLSQNPTKEFFEIEPRFYMQGSFSYKTINHPPKNTLRQIDMDDGVYLPMDILESRPILNKELFFSIVDKALEDLCKGQPGWEFDGSKDTCSRIIISPTSHVDFPLYAIPRDEFNKISPALNSAESFQNDEQMHGKPLDSNHVHLALRSQQHWTKSDPRKIRNWFDEQVLHYGKRLRRVCRYFKAWRDVTWPSSGGPSSIALMACVVDTFDRVTRFENESAAILYVAQRLPKQLREGIENPAETEVKETLFPKKSLSKDEQDKIVLKAEALSQCLEYSLCHAEDVEQCLDGITDAFGDRIPQDKYLINPCDKSGLAAPIKKQQSVKMADQIKSGTGIKSA